MIATEPGYNNNINIIDSIVENINIIDGIFKQVTTIMSSEQSNESPAPDNTGSSQDTSNKRNRSGGGGGNGGGRSSNKFEGKIEALKGFIYDTSSSNPKRASTGPQER